MNGADARPSTASPMTPTIRSTPAWQDLWASTSRKPQIPIQWRDVRSQRFEVAAYAPEADGTLLLAHRDEAKGVLLYRSVPRHVAARVFAAPRVQPLCTGPLRRFYVGLLGDDGPGDVDVESVDDAYWFHCDCGLLFYDSHVPAPLVPGYRATDDVWGCPRCGDAAIAVDITRCGDCFDLRPITGTHRCTVQLTVVR